MAKSENKPELFFKTGLWGGGAYETASNVASRRSIQQ
jgi:hypothetical protein